MNKNDELESVKMEIRSLGDSVKSGKVSIEDGTRKLDELATRKTNIEKEIAAENAPKMEKRSINYADLKQAMIEKRAITLGGTGAINQVKELFKVIETKTPVLAGVRKFSGANASTNITILSATPAVNNYAEGATDVSADTAAALESNILTPYAWVSELPISAEALKLGTVDIENELPVMFADAFAHAFHNGILTGDGKGRNFKGIFSSIVAANKIECATTGAITLGDVAKLAISIQDFEDDGVIIMNNGVYNTVMSSATGYDVYKESLARDKTIEGVKVILTSAAPSATVAGSIVAVAGRLSDYALGEAGEVVIQPKYKVGDTNTYFEATMFANGKPISANNYFGLATK